MNRIKKCRLEAGFAQKYIANVVGVSNQTVSYWENDMRTPSADNYIQLANIFGVSVDYLMGKEDSKTTAPVQTSAQVGEVYITTVPAIAAIGHEMEKMTPAQQEQLLAIGKAVFKEIWGKDNDTGL